MKKQLFTKSLALIVLVSATQSHAASISRCNAEVSSGVFKPMLQIEHGTRKASVFLGSRGLTRSIYFNDDRALAYAAKRLSIPKSDLPDDVSNCGGMPNEGGVPAPTITVTPEPEEPTLPETPVDPVVSDIVV